MITVTLCGGLGNQMFQYAAGRSLSLRLKAPLFLELRWFAERSGDTARPFELHRYPIRATWGTLGLWERLRRRVAGVPRIFTERDLSFDAAFHALTVPVSLNGYFQSEKYFPGIRETLLAEFVPREPLLEEDHLLKEEMASHASAALHVRRGDYANSPSTQAFHGLLDIPYYERAVAFVSAKRPVDRLYVFSDDILWAQDHLRFDRPIRFVSTGSGIRDMHLMSCCRHQIIANSSFSWWGAWLNTNPDKVVVAPERWFADEKAERQTGDLIPTGWVRL